MLPFDLIIQKLQKFQDQFWDNVAFIIKVNEEVVIQMNTDRIYNDSTDVLGEKLRNQYTNYSIYSPAYESYKRSLNLYRGKIDLSLTGEYLGSFELEINSKEVTIKSDQRNSGLHLVLVDLYGTEVQGLTDDQWQEFVNKYIAPKIIDELTEAL